MSAEMTLQGDRHVVADDVSFGWLGAIHCANTAPERKLVHLVVRILDPLRQTPLIRSAAESLMEERSALKSVSPMPPIETVRNTIFPAAWARRYPEPADLANHYRSHYTGKSLRGFQHNERGTYFGRIVAYPREQGDHADQLTDTVRKLRDEIRRVNPKSSRYEINIYSERKDRSPMSFPCLAHVSLHLHAGRLHMQAVYRNESLVRRGYGNYLGLSELLGYLASAVGAGVGELLVTVGHAELDAPKRQIDAMIASIQTELGAET